MNRREFIPLLGGTAAVVQATRLGPAHALLWCRRLLLNAMLGLKPPPRLNQIEGTSCRKNACNAAWQQSFLPT
jgi:hypothetical protein